MNPTISNTTTKEDMKILEKKAIDSQLEFHHQIFNVNPKKGSHLSAKE